jgi:thiol-disulfide isomerase/thioredoxin
VTRYLGLWVFVAAAYACRPTWAEDDAQRPEEPAGTSLATSVLLVRDPAVQAELGLSGVQAAAVGKLMEEIDGLLWVLRDVPPKEGERKLQALLAKVRNKLKEILSPAQRDRLNQVVLQSQGFSALLRPDLVRTLALSDDQQEQIRTATETTRRAFQKIDETARKGEHRDLLDKVAKRFRAEEREKVLAALTDRQKNQWEAMTGKAFNLSRIRPFAFKAPDLQSGGDWINSEPLTSAKLRGKVVLIHFWTFGCGNCIANYPAYKSWHQAYAGKGLTIIGIHTPETQGEHAVEKVREKARDNALTFPILVDNDRRNWDAWSNRVWPSVYLVDKRGRIRYWWYGELNWAGAKGEQLMRERG